MRKKHKGLSNIKIDRHNLMVTKDHILNSDSNCVHYITHVKGHIEMDHNMNSKFKCDHCKTKFAHKHRLKGCKEKDHILNLNS